ncbi:MAG: glycine--tRNA ligase [Candidatus Woesearchaeota archaeon]|jgi:glycyl-tRNA synthetase
MTLNIDEMASFCKRKGFIYSTAEIYGGLTGFFDYGPYGSELKMNIKNNWWQFFVRSREDIVGIDGPIITNPMVWRASGHAENFADLMLESEDGSIEVRADVFLEEKLGKAFDGITASDVNKLVEEHKLKASNGKPFKKCESFNMMFTTNVGPKHDEKSRAYLRPETAQLIFADFKLIQENARLKLPFGIAQMGKAFRNEISPRNFLFRCREFEQMEIEFFIHPQKRDCPFFENYKNFEIIIFSEEMQKSNSSPKKMKMSEVVEQKLMNEWHAYFAALYLTWFKNLGADLNNFRARQHLKDELAFYSSDCWDIEYNFPFGWKELQGFADRSDYDLKRHMEYSKKDLSLFDEETKEKIVPHVIAEPSLGVDRAFLVFLYEAYDDDKERGNVVLHLHPKLAPINLAVLPLLKNKPELILKTRQLFEDLKKDYTCFYDDSGSIGRRYARMDEIGTPYCITVDFDTLQDDTVTVRNRDSKEQERVKIEDLKKKLIL